MDFLFDYFIFNFKANNALDLFNKANIIFLKNNLVKKTYLQELITREKEYPTGLKFNNLEIAIPHVDDEHIIKQGIIIYHLNSNISFYHMGSDDQILTKVKFVFFLLIKKDQQIDLLNQLINKLNNKDTQKKLLQIKSKEELITSLKGDLIMKKIIVACGSGIATSQAVVSRLIDELNGRNIYNVIVEAVDIKSIDSEIKNADIYVSLVPYSKNPSYKIPVFDGIKFLTGFGKEEELAAIIKALKGS